MKHKITVTVLLLCFLMTSVSCSGSKQETDAAESGENLNSGPDYLAFDAINQEAEKLSCNPRYSRPFSNLAVSEDALFYITADSKNNKLIRYVDRTTGGTAPLCGKPECLHDSEECNAFRIPGVLSL